ncbi:Aminoglycoside phosphotransferase [Tolypocladium capitatum]|uniref:Aminoglycoside phosphotransferase n=1 Tax=Tolypocladium capitatum TaxID=45235 RepID=A0A2K3Q7Q3_9HYPO|nr:Aminoglycoside phosphotransferase [Tolypocladium capitatum]
MDFNVIKQAEHAAAARGFCQLLQQHEEDMIAITRHHLRLGPLDACQVQSQWMSGGFNVCVPIQVTGSFNGKLLMTCPLPHVHAEPHCPGSTVDESMRSEVGAYAWMRDNCPHIRIPRLYGFGFSNHRDFTHESRVSIHRRLWRRICRALYSILRYPTLTYFAPNTLGHGLPTAYMLMEYVGSDVGQKLSDTWEQQRQDSTRVETLCRSLSRIMLAMSRTEQPRIGSFRFNDDGTITLTNRPLTRSITMLEGAGTPGTMQANETYGCMDAFVADMLRLHDKRLLGNPPATDDLSPTADRAVMRALAHHFVRRERRNGPFAVQVADLHPESILVDANWNVTCILDLGEMCALPLEMESVPYWLAGCAVSDLTEKNLDEFERLRRRFMQILEEEEGNGLPLGRSLSAVMHQTWESQAVWFWHSLRSIDAAFHLIPHHLLTKCQGHHFAKVEESSRFRCENNEVVSTKWHNGDDGSSSRGEAESYGESKSERDTRREAYIKSIEIADVCKLASNNNMMKVCHEFRQHEHGSFNVCFFLEFPSDGKKWVVRFPIGPVLHGAWRKLQSEISTMEYIKRNTTIPIPRVYGYGPGGRLDTDNPTGLPYVILEYIPGRPLDAKDLVGASPDASKAFYSQLAHILSQLRMQEFDYAGSLTTDSEGRITLTSPHSVDLNSIQLHSTRRTIPCRRQSSAIDFAYCRYQVLLERLNLPTSVMDEEDAQHEVFALEDFKGRLFNFIDPSLNHQPFVLTHGDLRPSNIIVGEDLTINAIIDWEWSCTVPRQFFIPPMWFAGHDMPRLSDKVFRLEYSKFHQALTNAGLNSAACRMLADEWGSDLNSSRLDFFLPAALLHHQNFTLIYYLVLFPEFYKDIGRRDKIREFYERDAGGVFNDAVRRKVEASEKYARYLHDNGLSDDEASQDAQLQELIAKSQRMLARFNPTLLAA